MNNLLIGIFTSLAGTLIFSLLKYFFNRLRYKKIKHKLKPVNALIKERTIFAYTFPPVGAILFFLAGFFNDSLLLSYIFLQLSFFSFLLGGMGVVFLAEYAKHKSEPPNQSPSESNTDHTS